MYADQVGAGAKRSVKERLNGGLGDDLGRSRPASAKRQRQGDDRWKHDLFQEDGHQVSKAKVGAEDLRLKLQRKGSQQAYSSGKESRARDLREKLSGTMHAQPANTDLTKAKSVSEAAKPPLKSISSVQATVADTKKVPATTSSSQKSQKKSELSVDGLLRSLGLEKYSIQFQAEEIDMAALRHMNDDDLKALGIPMGPRKKILLALDSRS